MDVLGESAFCLGRNTSAMPGHLYPIPPAVSVLPVVPSPPPTLAWPGPHACRPKPERLLLAYVLTPWLLLGVTPLGMTVSPLGWSVSKARACCILIGLYRQTPFITHSDGRGPVPSSSFWLYLRFTKGWLFYFWVVTISHWLLGPLGEKVHFDKVSFPESSPVLCAKHIIWNAVFAHLNLTSFEWNVTVLFLPVRKIFKYFKEADGPPPG